ncbi:MAG: CehA/McbA family metallohydrolase [Nocardioides sp.]
MCEQHRVERRTLLAAGAVVSTTAAVVSVPAAAAGRTRTIRFTGRFDGVADPDWHYLPFRVPKGVKEIRVSYDYTPLQTGAGFSANVIDIGMFDSSGFGLGNAAGFRGWSGGARKAFRIGHAGATKGYLPGPINPGVWRVILGPFLVLPPGVDFSVTVTLRFGQPGPRFKAQPPPRRVSGTGPGWYRGDLHLHTRHSDGTHTQPSLAGLAREAGLDFIGSAEHNTSSAGLTWGKHVRPGDPLLVLCGEEITTRNGHWLAMGVPAGTWIDWRYRATDAVLGRFTRQVRSLGGIAIACHPWVPIPGTKWDFGYDYASMDAVEIWNGPWTLDDQVGVVAWHAMLVGGRFVPVVGNSDSHRPDQTVGRAQTVVQAATLSVGAIVAGIRAGRSWLAESSAVDLAFTATLGGTTVSCGDRLPSGPTDLVDVRLEVAGAPTCLAQIIGPALPLAGALTDTAGRATVTSRVPAALAPFVRAEVRRLDGAPVLNPLEGVPALAMVAMTNPIFLG